jgi:hypothetical protein
MAPLQSRRTFLRNVCALTLAGCVSACGQQFVSVPVGSPLPTTSPPERFDGALALEHAAAQMQWVPRDTGSPGWKQCGDYIVGQFKGRGWAVEEQFFDYQGTRCRNIIARRGSGPYIILGAHYDSRRRADQDPDPAKRDQPVPAANDGASGIAVLIELARVLKPEALGNAIWLAAFDAEDNGELDGWEWTVGSGYMARNLSIPPQATIVVDMIGDADQQIYYEGNSDPSIKQAIWSVASELGYTSFVPQVGYSMIDDHTPFLRRGYRAVDLIDFDYPAWHTTADTLDKISAASLEAVGRTLQEWLQRSAPGIIGTPVPTPAYPIPNYPAPAGPTTPPA